MRRSIMGESAPILSSADPASFQQARGLPPSVVCAPVEFTPADIARRDITRWNGIAADSVAVMRREPYEYRLHASCHLLIMAERAERDDGETLVDGLPKS